VPIVDDCARSERLEQQIAVLSSRLEASEQRVEELEVAFDEIVAQRDAALADVVALVDQMNDLADLLEAS
jgi:chromosome segregation ATPase